MDKDTNLHKELDLIQNCISRMAKNSFMLKGWSISLMAVVLALTADRLNALFLLCSVFIPLLIIWLQKVDQHTTGTARSPWPSGSRPRRSSRAGRPCSPLVHIAAARAAARRLATLAFCPSLSAPRPGRS